MRKKLTVILFFFAVCLLHVQAQAPWRAKLFVHFQDSTNQIVTDTVYFGCDSLGADGFQEGLDILDTVVKPNRVYGYDSLVQIQKNTGCVNLRRNIKAFKKGEYIDFNFYALGKVVALSYDTLDFIYNDSVYKVRGVMANSDNASLRGIDLNSYIIYNINRPYNKFLDDSILFISDQASIPFCNTTTILPVAHLNIHVAMGYGFVGMTSLSDHRIQIAIYPNPSKGLFTIQWQEDFNGKAVLYDYTGKQLSDIPILNTSSLELNTEEYPSGLYVLKIMDESGKVVSCKKIIKIS